MKNQKGFVQIILVLILVALVGGGMYYFGKMSNKSNVVVETPTEEPIAMETQKPGTPTVKPTTDPTAGWKTYTSDVYSLSFKYPANYVVEEKVSGFWVIKSSSDPQAQAGISVDSRLISPYSSISEAGKVINDGYNLSEKKTISSWEVFQGKGKSGMLEGVEFRIAIASYKTGAIEAEVLVNTKYVNDFDQILSTFKFTK